MASGKKSSLLSSLADYGDDSEPDSDIDGEDTGTLCFIHICMWFTMIKWVLLNVLPNVYNRLVIRTSNVTLLLA